MQNTVNRYSRKLRNKVINKADSYIPLGMKLEDFSDHFRVIEDEDRVGGEDNDDVEETIRVVEDEWNSTRPSSAETLSDRVISKVLVGRRNLEVNQQVMSNDVTFVEVAVPYNNKLIDERMVSSGLSLFNLAINSDVIGENSSKKFLTDSMIRLLNGIASEDKVDVIKHVFKAMSDDVKGEIIEEYLNEEELVSKMTGRYSSSSSTGLVLDTDGLDEQVAKLVKLTVVLSSMVYGKLIKPFVLFSVSVLISLNQELNLLESFLRVSVGVLVMMLGFVLRVLVIIGGRGDGSHAPDVDNATTLITKALHRSLDRLLRH